LNAVLNDEHKLHEGTCEIKIFNPRKNKGKNLIFEMVYAFVNNIPKYMFEGEEIGADELVLQVKLH
jgi:hypothetical protein